MITSVQKRRRRKRRGEANHHDKRRGRQRDVRERMGEGGLPGAPTSYSLTLTNFGQGTP
jgi:hypothetical protein